VPSFLREVLLACALVDNVDYIVSSKILIEWSRASKSLLDRLEAEVAITQFRKIHAEAIRPDATSLAQFWLPDPNDIHILGLAVEQSANFIITYNKKDFPNYEVQIYGIKIMDPDEFLRNLFKNNADNIRRVLKPVLNRVRYSNTDMSMTEIWEKAWLPQFGRLFNRL
jgi:predicted nucleic acid-binding protein